MRRFLLSTAGAGLLGYAAWAAEVPQALSSTGPALASFENHLVVAWAGDSATEPHKVWYSSFDGVWSPQATVPGASTTVAPALATADQQLYLATTGTDERIYYYVSQNGTFDDDRRPLCDAATCAHTRAAPALAGGDTTLFAAWSTPTGAIRYAELENGAWDIRPPLPFDSAVTKPTTAPTVSVYLGRLYVAWVAPRENAIWVASTALPLTNDSWSEPPIKVAAKTDVAPALGVLAGENSAPSSAAEANNVLYLSWTDADSTLKFARLDSLFGKWVTTDPPVPLPPGPLTHFTPALTTCLLAKPVTSATDVVPDAAAKTRYNVVGVTRPQGMVDIFCGQHTGPSK